jgi:hypothetical protein
VKSKTWAATTAFAILLTATMASPAMAADSPGSASPHAACGIGDYNYEDVGDVETYSQAPGFYSKVSGDPGVTLSISRSVVFTVSGSLGATSSISGSVIVLTAQQQLNVTLTATISGTSSTSGAWTVPANYTNGGTLQIGAWKHRGTIEKFQAKPSNCTDGTLLSSTNYNAPEDNFYFRRSRR